MPPSLTPSLGLKVAVALTVIMLATAAAVIAVSTNFARSLGQNAADQGANALHRQATDALQRITMEQARRYGAQLQRTEDLTRLLSERVTDVLANPDLHRSRRNLALSRDPDRNILTNGPEAPVSVLYFLGGRADPATRRLIARLSHIDPLLREAHRQAFAGTAAWYTSERGFVRYAPNLPLIEELPKRGDHDIRTGHFYRVATPEQNPQRETVWTRVYRDPAGQGLMVTAAHPVYGPEGKFRGVAGIDVALTEISEQILASQPLPSPNGQEPTASGQQFHFLVDADGQPIALPRRWRTPLGLPDGTREGQGTRQQSLLQSAPRPIRDALRRARQDDRPAVSRVQLNGAHFLLAIHRVPGTGWLLGSVVAQERVLAEVGTTRQRIGSEVATLTRILIAVSVAALVAALLIASAYVRWSVVKPLRALAQGAEHIRNGDYGHRVAVKRADEIGQTARAFNAMSDQLAGLVDELEQRVAERTREAQEARHYFQSILENSPVAIGFFDADRRIREINSAFLDLTGYTRDQLLGHPPEFLYANQAEYERIGREAYPALRDGQTFTTTSQFIDAAGQTFPGVLQGRAVNPQDLSEGFIWAIQDITEQKRLEDELRLLATTFRTSQATFITDAQGHIERVNPAFTEITGYQPDEVIGKNPRIFQSGYQDSAFYREMWQQILEEGHWEGEIWNRRKDGSSYPLYESVSVVRDEAGNIQHFVAVFHDISEQKRLEAELDYQASHDRLTGLLNRKHLEQLITEEISRAQRYGTTFSLIMFDLDHFKQVNDQYGHHAGDELLVQVGQRVRELLRESDQIGRWGGEEFMLLLPETSREDAVALAERLRRAVAEANLPALPPVTISLGVDEYRANDGLDDLTRRVDDALYAAKAKGRDRVEPA